MPPKRAASESLQPPPAPAAEGLLAHVEQLGENLHASRRGAVLEGASEDHDRAEIDVTAEETDRGRRVALAAAILRAAEAEAAVMHLRQTRRPASGLARVGPGVQTAAAGLAARGPHLGSGLAVNLEEQLMESGRGKDGMGHWAHSDGLVVEGVEPSRAGLIKLTEGARLTSLGLRDQNRAQVHQIM